MNVWMTTIYMYFRYSLFLKCGLWVRKGTNIHFHIVSFKVSHMLHHTKCSPIHLNSTTLLEHYHVLHCPGYRDVLNEFILPYISFSHQMHRKGTSYYSFIKQAFFEWLLYAQLSISSSVFHLVPSFWWSGKVSSFTPSQVSYCDDLVTKRYRQESVL